MAGLNSAGKITILNQCEKEETLEYKGLNFIVVALDGHDIFRTLWKTYYKNTNGVIFVVDANDRDTIEDAADVLKQIMEDEELKNSCLLILANKQDLNGALAPNEVTEKLRMGQFRGRQWLVQGTCATTGEGLKNGLDWMADVLLKKKKEINNQELIYLN